MSEKASSKDIKTARKLIQKLAKEAATGGERYSFELADEALGTAELNYHYRNLNTQAAKLVHKAHEKAKGQDARAWDYVLRLLEEDFNKRGG